jgi:hypothetical protein
MRRRVAGLGPVLFALGIAAGCGGDVSTMLSTHADLRDKVIGVFQGNTAMAGQMVDRLLAGDSSRTVVLDRLFASGPVVDSVIARIAKHPRLVDGVLDQAVRDTAMRTHVLTLIKGMEMATAAAP